MVEASKRKHWYVRTSRQQRHFPRTMVDGSAGSGTSEAIVASQSIVSTWLIPIMWRAGTFIGGLLFLAVGALYYKQVSRPTRCRGSPWVQRVAWPAGRMRKHIFSYYDRILALINFATLSISPVRSTGIAPLLSFDRWRSTSSRRQPTAVSESRRARHPVRNSLHQM